MDAFLSDYLLSESHRDKGLVLLCGRWFTMGIEEWRLKKKSKDLVGLCWTIGCFEVTNYQSMRLQVIYNVQQVSNVTSIY